MYVCFYLLAVLSVPIIVLPINNTLVSLVYYFFLNFRLECESIPRQVHSDGTESSYVVTASVSLLSVCLHSRGEARILVASEECSVYITYCILLAIV